MSYKLFKYFSSTMVFIMLLLVANISLACEECVEILDIQETVDAADIVIVGQRTDYTKGEKKPEGITIYVERVFKGDVSPLSKISVKTMYGMCDYGIYMKDEQALIFLKRIQKPKWGWQAITPHKFDYTSVSYGCAYKTIPIVDNKLKIRDKFVTIDELADGKILTFPPRIIYKPPPEKGVINYN